MVSQQVVWGLREAARAVARAHLFTCSGLGESRARFCGAAVIAARSAVAAGVAAGEEGGGARSMLHDPISLRIVACNGFNLC